MAGLQFLPWSHGWSRGEVCHPGLLPWSDVSGGLQGTGGQGPSDGWKMGRFVLGTRENWHEIFDLYYNMRWDSTWCNWDQWWLSHDISDDLLLKHFFMGLWGWPFLSTCGGGFCHMFAFRTLRACPATRCGIAQGRWFGWLWRHIMVISPAKIQFKLGLNEGCFSGWKIFENRSSFGLLVYRVYSHI